MELLRRVYIFLLDGLQTFLLAAAAFLVVYMFLFRPFQVSGQSMFPNFHDKEYALTNLVGLHFSKLKLGDVIVFKAPPEPDKDFIKRVIGVPRDKIYVQDGSVYLNGAKLDESEYLSSSVKTYGGSFLKDGEQITVPPDNYFVMGDNREYSSDSREWGLVPFQNVIGISLLVYWPVNEFRLVRNPY